MIWQKRVTDLSDLALDRFVARARRAAGLKGKVNVLVTSSTEMKSLNRRFRGKDKPTDVLAFPLQEGGSALKSPGSLLLGDVIVSIETARRQATRPSRCCRSGPG